MEGYFDLQKSLVPFFTGTYKLFLLTANENLDKEMFSCVKTKIKSHFAVKCLKLFGSFHGAASRTAVFLKKATAA